MKKSSALSASSAVRSAGFTLVELLVAMAIIMVVFLVGFTLINGASDIRRQSEARIRASENARLFFQLLERDFAGAYPTGLISTNDSLSELPPYKLPVTPKGTDYTIDSSYLRFYTRMDTQAPLDEYVCVRYYVNNLEQLCREAQNALEVQNALLDKLTSTSPEQQSSDHALFDETYSLNVGYQIWDTQNKKFNDSNTTPNGATHLLITLTLFERPFKSNVAKTDSTIIRHTFDKRLPIPAGFERQ
ncbi:MAG: prepilin-type N-terminal cleavage/methylation domain-containing protein [Planctomycetota bacterium]